MGKIETINKVLLDNGMQSYLVGGCVRDMYLDKKPHDFDFATNSLPENTVKILKNSKNIDNVYMKGIQFGTVIADIDGEEFEITTFRKDGKYDGHKPTSVTFSDTIEADLSRRDFTINAMAIDGRNGELVDIFNGKKDIEARIIRTVGNPIERFTEDPLRILRAIRFAITLNFNIAEETKKAIHECKDELKYISKERITEELKKIFNSNHNIKDVFMEFRDVIAVCIPQLQPCFDFEQNNKYHDHDVYEHILSVVDGINTKYEQVPIDRFALIKFAALFHDIGKPQSYSIDNEGFGHFYGHPKESKRIFEEICRNNLSFTNKEKDYISNLVEYHDIELTFTEKGIRRMLNSFPDRAFINDLCILKESDRLDHINFKDTIDFQLYMKMIDTQIEKAMCFSLKDLNINGNDMMALGLTGKDIGNMLHLVLDEVIDGNLENNREMILEYVRQHIYNKDTEYER